jgi:hypothetical protein
MMRDASSSSDELAMDAMMSFSATDSQMGVLPSNVTDCDDDRGDVAANSWYRSRYFRFGSAAVLIVVCLIVGIVLGTNNSRTSTTLSASTPFPTSVVPSAAPTSIVQVILDKVALEGGAEFEDESTYQSKARSWLEGNADVDQYSVAQIVQRYALACFFFATYGVANTYTPPMPFNWVKSENWITDMNECDWYGVTCENDKVVTIDLTNNNITGSVPLEFGMLGSSLERLDLSGNAVANKDEELAWIAELRDLLELSVYFCNFDSPGVSTYIGKLTKLSKYLMKSVHDSTLTYLKVTN